MRTPLFPRLSWIAAAAALCAAAPCPAAELYLSGDLGISWLSGDGVGVNDIVGSANSGESEDQTPVWGGGLGMVFPLNTALPMRWRMPWIGSDDEWSFPDWAVRTEVEHLRGRDAELTTPSFTPLDAYRVDVQSWTLMGKVRLDVPIRAPVHALLGRAPFLDPFTIYGGGGAGISMTDLEVSTGILVGSQRDKQQFAWQALAGVGYDLNEHMKLSVGWRYIDFGQAKTQLIDSTFTNRGRYRIDLEAHEFTASISVWFWRLPPILGDE